MYRSNQYIAARISPVQLIVARSCHTYGLVLRVSLVSETPRDDVHYQGAGRGEKFLGMKMIWPRMSKSTFKYSHYKSIEEGTMAGHMREIARVSRSQLPHSHSSSRRNMIKYMIDNLAPSLDSASRLVLASAQPAGGSSPFSEGAGRPSHPRARGHDRSLRAL